jgi:predicted dehydrogenase
MANEEDSSSVSRRTFLHGAAGAVGLTAAAYGKIAGANDRVGVGFIGFGLIGKRHVLDFLEQKDAALVAVAEAHRGRLAEARSTIGGEVAGYSDFRKMLDNRDVQAVVVSTPDHWHALMTMLACAAGKDVYVEKPLTLFVREGRWMVDVAKRTGRVVQVGTQQRSGAHFQAARKLVRDGHIGKILSVRMTAYRNIMPGFGSPADCPPPADLDWDMFLGPAPLRPYNPNRGIYHFRWFWDTSGGQMTNLGHHSLDLVHWFLGADPSAVTSAGGRFALTDNGETPDTQDVIIEYPGLTAIWSHREASGGSFGGAPVEFFGTKGRLGISRGGYTVTPDRKISPANRIPQAAGAGHPVGGPQRSADAGPTEYWTTAAEDRTGSERDQFKRHVRDFLDCVKSRKQPISDLESGHRVSTVCHLANLSLRLGRRLRWDAAKEEIVGDADANRYLVRAYRAPWDAELRTMNVGGMP